MTRTRRTLTRVTAIGATLALAAGLTAATTSSAGAQQAAPTQKTRFALLGWAYGTAVSPPVASAPTGYESIGCTTRTGINNTNHQAQVTVPGLGVINGLRSNVWTTRSGKTVSTWARNSLGQVTLSDSPLGSVVLDAVSSTSRAWHDGTRFRTSTDVSVAKLLFKPPVGAAIPFQLPTPKRPVTIPGVAKVEFAPTTESTTAHRGLAVANGLKVTLIPTKSVVKVARSVAEISDGIVTGVFGGYSYAVGGKAAGDIVNLGRNPLLKMRCPGTQNETQTRKLVGLDLGDGSIGAATSSQRAVQTAKHAVGWERSSLAGIKLGPLEINGIVARAAVSRGGKKLSVLKRSVAGTRIGELKVNGQVRELPINQTLTIPGVAKLQPRIVTNLPAGVEVTALRITLLDGSGAVINLGNARMIIRRSLK